MSDLTDTPSDDVILDDVILDDVLQAT